MLRQGSNVKLQLSDTNVPQFAEVPPAVICCKNILTKHPKFQNNKVSDSLLILYQFYTERPNG